MSKKAKKKKVILELDTYEALLLDRLQKDLEKQQGRKTKLEALILGCVRTSIHRVYGPEYVYSQLLDKQTFKDWADSQEI